MKVVVAAGEHSGKLVELLHVICKALVVDRLSYRCLGFINVLCDGIVESEFINVVAVLVECYVEAVVFVLAVADRDNTGRCDVKLLDFVDACVGDCDELVTVAGGALAVEVLLVVAVTHLVESLDASAVMKCVKRLCAVPDDVIESVKVRLVMLVLSGNDGK